MVLRNPLRRVFFRVQKTETRSPVAAAVGCVRLRSSRKPYKHVNRWRIFRPEQLAADAIAPTAVSFTGDRVSPLHVR